MVVMITAASAAALTPAINRILLGGSLNLLSTGSLNLSGDFTAAARVAGGMGDCDGGGGTTIGCWHAGQLIGKPA